MSFGIRTIERFILDNQPSQAKGDLTSLLYDLALAAKMIASKTSRAGLTDILGAVGSTNVQGESQQKLDVYADRMIFKLCDHTGRLCIMASEENEEPLEIPAQYGKGPYVLVFDPLDGSSNIDVNISVGTIFGIFRRLDPENPGSLEDLLQPGSALVAAGYILYGSSTMMVYSTGHGVHGFTLDPAIGEFILSHPDIRLPEPRYYSANHSNYTYWPEPVRDYVKALQRGADGLPHLSERYIGSLVADFHRNLLKGGIFLYPADPRKPEGKLRLLYEAAPLAFLIEQAGGTASNGVDPILSIKPESLHQRTPLYIGNTDLVSKAEEYLAKVGA